MNTDFSRALFASILHIFLFAGNLFCKGEEIKGLADYLEEVGENERETMKKNSPEFSSAAATFLIQRWDNHLIFFNEHGFSQFWSTQKYGNSGQETIESHLKRKCGSKTLSEVQSQLVRHSCVEFTLDAIEAGMTSVGMEREFGHLKKLSEKSDLDGAVLVIGLQKLGWKVYYYNTLPSLSVPEEESKEEREIRIASAIRTMKKWDEGFMTSTRPYGPHWWSWYTTVNRGNYKYKELKVDDAESLVGFGETPPQLISEIPFCVAIGNNAYHVFPIVHGEVIEGHSGLDIWNPKIIERNPFNPARGGRGAPGLKVGASDNGGPTGSTFLYSSGLICVPPSMTP